MFKWIERKILRPIIKNPVEAIIGGAAIATMGPAAAGVIGKLSAGTKVALASSAASTAGAILTRNDAKKENTRVLAANKAESERVYERNKKEVVESREYNTGVRENYYDNLVKDAQKAGINPLTALRAGGGSAYGTAVAGTMAQSVMMDGVYATPTLSRNPIAAGLETGVNVGLAEFTRQQNYSHESRMDELNKSLILAQVKSINSEIARGNYDDEALDLKFAGADVEIDENFSNVEDYEERYGDIVGSLVGLGVAIADARKTAMVLMSNESTANFSRNRRRKTKQFLPPVTVTTLKGPQKRGEMRGAY